MDKINEIYCIITMLESSLIVQTGWGSGFHYVKDRAEVN